MMFFKKFVVVFALGFGVGMQSVASTVLKVDFNNVVNAAEMVFQGQVISKEVRSLPNGQPMTFITFDIDNLIKGSILN